jgi:uroporphyrinogen-III synthase
VTAASRALAGVRIAITRPSGQAAGLARPLEAAGARVIYAPLIRILHPGDAGPLAAAAHAVGRYDWLVFTSVNAVSALAAVSDSTEWRRARVAAVGHATAAALAELGVAVTVVPDTKDADSLGAAIIAMGDIAGRRVLWPRAAAARLALRDHLHAHGARVDAPAAYRTEADPGSARALAEVVAADGVDVLAFTSPSAVRSYSEAGGRVHYGMRIAAIGPVTADAARRAGMPVHVLPDDASAERLAAAIIDAFGSSA